MYILTELTALLMSVCNHMNHTYTRALSCDIHTDTPAQTSHTHFVLYPFVI